jgi:hypothetical protein
MHAVMNDLQLLLVALVVFDQLSDVRSSRKVEHKVICDLGVCIVEML